jgi:predicted transcriptional regulator of viral defense system
MHNSIQELYTVMSKTISNLGSRESAFLMELAGSGKKVFTLQEAVGFWGSGHNAKIALHRLVQKKMLAQIEKGKYLILPLEAGPERKWTEDPYLVASALVQPSAIAYWSAIRHWNWTEQIPRIIYVQTTRRKSQKERTVFGVRYEFVTVSPRKFYGHAKEWRNGKEVLVTDKEKTLVDCADDVERAGTIEELAKAVRSAAREISWVKLSEYVGRFPNRAVAKRLGYLLETLVPGMGQEAGSVLSTWQSNLTTGVVPLQPSKKKSGRISTRWRVLVNARIG